MQCMRHHEQIGQRRKGMDGNMSEIGSVLGVTARADGRAVAKASDLEVERGVTQGVGRSPLSLTVNGQIRTMVVEPRMTLLDALREELALTATKKGCDRGECGACTVHVEGRRVLPGGPVARRDSRTSSNSAATLATPTSSTLSHQDL